VAPHLPRTNPIQRMSRSITIGVFESMSSEHAVAADAGRKHVVPVIVAVVLVSGVLYFGRSVLEPIAFVLFAMALVEPFREATVARLGKGVALTLTLLLTLLVLLFLYWPLSGVLAILFIGAWGMWISSSPYTCEQNNGLRGTIFLSWIYLI
jgi:hypothetical protein